MARGYLSGAVRCKQLERLVHAQPGVTIEELVSLSGMSYPSVCVYMVRLRRERRVEAQIEDSSLAPKGLQRFFPPGAAPKPPLPRRVA